jgi:hypothetical protein
MKKYIFITPEGLTYKPNCDSPEPDFPDMQIIGYGTSTTIEDALKDLMEMSGNLFENNSAQNFSLRFEGDNKRHLWPSREHRSKVPLAS